MKKGLIIFIAICMIVCALPLAAMTVRPTTVSTENRALSVFPSLQGKEGGLNLKFFEEFEKYFNEHFAFRNELVYADAQIMSSIFKVSATKGVILGKNGWLYYTSTLDDYLGANIMSEREVYNVAHNLLIVKDYLDAKGIKLLVTFPPNKNTLYGSNMPYYDSYVVDPTHNIELIGPALDNIGVPYLDLLTVFQNESEVLYLERDSHWNMKGALLAYNSMMNEIGHKHNDYSEANVKRAIDEVGDLNKMLYTLYGKKEANYKYDIPMNYRTNDGYKDVEDAWIETSCDEGGVGTLLMFRDSFGNTLIPFIANQYRAAWFTKAVPYELEKLVNQHKPSEVIIEKVERNVADFIKAPPTISALTFDGTIGDSCKEADTDTEVSMATYMYDAMYYEIKGNVLGLEIANDANIIAEINGTLYRTYHIGNNGFVLHLRKEANLNEEANIRIIVEDHSGYTVVYGGR